MFVCAHTGKLGKVIYLSMSTFVENYSPVTQLCLTCQGKKIGMSFKKNGGKKDINIDDKLKI